MKIEGKSSSLVTRRQFLIRSGISMTGISLAGSAYSIKNLFKKNELPPYIIEKGLADDPLLILGFLNLKHYAKGDGITDDTVAFQKALNDIYNYDLALYIPPGTYIVSDMLDCRVDLVMDNGNLKPKKGYPVFGDPDNRSVIKLIDHAISFQDVENPRPIMKIWVDHPQRGEAGAWMMDSGGVSSIIIDCGKENPGAIGFKCWGAQAQFVENLTVKAYGAYAGIKDTIGNAGYMANLEVYGGKYGIWAQYGQTGAIAGCTLIDQEVAAVRQELYWPLTIAGFKIVKESGPVVEIKDRFGEFFNGHLSLNDGIVILKQKSPAFINTDNSKGGKGRDLYLRNVYVKNADTLVKSFGHDAVPAKKNEWTHVIEYAYACKDGVIRINGKDQDKELIKLDTASPPPKLAERHMLKRKDIPFGLDKDAICIKDKEKMGSYTAKGDGVTDDTEAFRYAIARYPKIFVPKGVYKLTGTILLKKNTVLFGITPHLSVLMPDADSWKDEESKSAITTPDDPEASCILSLMAIKPLAKELEWKGAYPVLDWKAGRNSVVKNIFPNTDFSNFPPDSPYILISGNGGGKWYGFDGGSDPFAKPKYVVKEKYHHSLVRGTHEMLVIYSHCAIHGKLQYNNVIENAENIELYGVMDETHSTYMKILKGSNILITGHGGHLGKREQEPSIPNYELTECNDVTMSIISSHYPSDKTYHGEYWLRIKDDQGVITGDKSVAYYRLGDGKKIL